LTVDVALFSTLLTIRQVIKLEMWKNCTEFLAEATILSGYFTEKMKLREEIKNQFISPTGANIADIKAISGRVTQSLLDFLSLADSKSTSPQFQQEQGNTFQMPEKSKAEDDIQKLLQSFYQKSMNPANPRYIGHMDSVPTLWSVLGSYISSGLNQNMLSLEMSPVATQLEYSLAKQFAGLFGLPDSGGGIMLSGGTLSNLQALVVARNSSLGLHQGNFISNGDNSVLFCSEHAHASISKAWMIMGMNANSIIKVSADGNSAMSVVKLRTEIQDQLAKGKQPMAIVATAGTTVTGNIDPLSAICDVAEEYGIWLHVDAIYGGAVIFSEKYKHLIDGISKADSISFNPQKWMYVAKTCSMVLFRDFTSMIHNFRTAAPYMKDQSSFINLGEISIQGTKFAESLKLWLSLLGMGKSGYGELIDYGFYLKDVFVSLLKKRAYLKLSSEPEMNIICFRGEPRYLEPGGFDFWNEQLQVRVSEKGSFFLSLPRYQNKLWLRAVLLNPFLEAGHLETLFSLIDEFEIEQKENHS